MQITRQTEYAVRTLLELSTLPSDQLLPTRVISERQDVPEVFLKRRYRFWPGLVWSLPSGYSGWGEAGSACS